MYGLCDAAMKILPRLLTDCEQPDKLLTSVSERRLPTSHSKWTFVRARLCYAARASSDAPPRGVLFAHRCVADEKTLKLGQPFCYNLPKQEAVSR